MGMIDDAALGDLLRRFDHHPARETERSLSALGLSYRTFHVNAYQLITAAGSFENAFLPPLLDPGRFEELHEFAYEIVRLFQNTVTAGESFVQHVDTSITVRYRNSPLLEQFQSELGRRVTDDPVYQFVGALRDFQMHRGTVGFAFAHGVLGFPNVDSPMQQILPTLSAFREYWKGRRNVGRFGRVTAYLATAGDTIDSVKLINQYQALLHGFRVWHRTREAEVNPDLEELRNLRREILKRKPQWRRYLIDRYPDDD